MCRCGPNVKSAVAGNRIKVAVLTAVSPLPPHVMVHIGISMFSLFWFIVFIYFFHSVVILDHCIATFDIK